MLQVQPLPGLIERNGGLPADWARHRSVVPAQEDRLWMWAFDQSPMEHLHLAKNLSSDSRSSREPGANAHTTQASGNVHKISLAFRRSLYFKTHVVGTKPPELSTPQEGVSSKRRDICPCKGELVSILGDPKACGSFAIRGACMCGAPHSSMRSTSDASYGGGSPESESESAG